MRLLLLMLFSAVAYSNEVEKLVIIGSGPAGLTCSLFAGQAFLEPLVIEGNQAEGQISAVNQIENYPGFPEGISGEELASRLRFQAEKFGAKFCPNSVVAVDLSQRPYKLTFQDGEELCSECLVIATGASPRWLGLDSEKALIGHGVSANALTDAPKFSGKNVCVVGGGDSAMEQALLLAEYANHVDIFYKGESLIAAKYLQERVLNNPKISISLNTVIKEVIGIDVGHVTGVKIKEKVIPLEGIFVCNGRKPNTDMFIGQLEMNDKGYILTQGYTSLTNKPGVFAAGDITQSAYRKVTTAVASGCIAALDAAKFLAEKE